MTSITSKICVIGEFAVGKTSTVERFVNSQFSDKYLTSIGVKVDTKNLSTGGIDLKLVIWDIAGTDKFGEVEYAYLRGASGYIMVADGTRFNTVTAVQALQSQVVASYGELPCVFLINKSDLSHDWEVTDENMGLLRRDCKDIFVTSAKTGDQVDQALSRLAALIIESDIG